MPRRTSTPLFALTVLLLSTECSVLSDDSATLIRFSEDFENGIDRWETLDPQTLAAQCARQNHTFEITARESDYKPAVRSPGHIALINDRCSWRTSNSRFGCAAPRTRAIHRDCCIFFGWQDPTHFYYAHLGAKPDPASGQIMIVNDAPRTPLTTNRKRVPGPMTGINVKVVRIAFDRLHRRLL